jgi:GNAT superfamily N-acetyltransferase
MELYKQYLLERENTHLHYDEDSFIAYEFIDNYCFIKELYVSSEQRRIGKATLLVNMIQDLAKEKGMKYVMGGVCLSANGWQKSLALMYKEGYNLKEIIKDMIYLIKDL